MTELLELAGVISLAHARAVSADVLHVLLSDAPWQDQTDPQSLLIACNWAGEVEILFQSEGHHDFIVPGSGVPLIVSVGGQVSSASGRIQPTFLPATDELDGPEKYGLLTCLCTCLDHLYAAGMSRQVYRTDPLTAVHVHIDEGVLDRDMTIDGAGFHGLAPTPEGGLVAVGVGGAIWYWVEGRWKPMESGSNIALNSVAHLGGSRFVACGVDGMLLEFGNGWAREIENPCAGLFLSDIAVLKRRAFFVADNGVHFVEASNTAKYSGYVKHSETTRFLTASEDVLWAIGRQKIGRTRDGCTWEWKSTADFLLTT